MKVEKVVLNKQRVRKIDGAFSWFPRSFLLNGFLACLSKNELLLYFLLTLVSDRKGLSYYSQDKLGLLLKISVDDFINARNGLIAKDLIAFDGFMFQVLSLPDQPRSADSKPLRSADDFINKDPLTIRRIMDKAFSGKE